MPEPDILTKLRAAAGTAYNFGDKGERLNRYKLHMSDAADEIERLRALAFLPNADGTQEEHTWRKQASIFETTMLAENCHRRTAERERDEQTKLKDLALDLLRRERDRRSAA